MTFIASPRLPCAEPIAGWRAEPTAGWRAEEVFLGWLGALPPGIDPSDAAAGALARLAALAGPPGPEGSELGRLRALLAETMGWNRPALAMLPRRPGRRRPA